MPRWLRLAVVVAAPPAFVFCVLLAVGEKLMRWAEGQRY